MSKSITVTITVDAVSLGDIENINEVLQALHGVTSPAETEAPSKPKATRSRSKPAGKGKAKKPELVDDDPLGVGDDDAPSVDDVKAAVNKRIEADESQDGVRAVFAEFGAKKLSDIDADDYTKVIAALQEDDISL